MPGVQGRDQLLANVAVYEKHLEGFKNAGIWTLEP